MQVNFYFAFNPFVNLVGTIPICTSIIAMDHQEITSIGDPKEINHIFENVRELDISTNQIRFWSDVG